MTTIDSSVNIIESPRKVYVTSEPTDVPWRWGQFSAFHYQFQVRGNLLYGALVSVMDVRATQSSGEDWLEVARRARAQTPRTCDSTDLLRMLREGEMDL